MISEKTKEAYIAILNEELVPAMGCTEPIAIAFASAILRDVLGTEPIKLYAGFSGNIIKNVKSVIVPCTGGKHGIESALAAGIISGKPEMRLEVLQALDEGAGEAIDAFLGRCKIQIEEIPSGCAFELCLVGSTGEDRAEVRILGAHTNVTLVQKNGTDLTEKYSLGKAVENTYYRVDRSCLNVEDIVEFAETVDISLVADLLRSQLDMNMAIAKEGLANTWGASIGRLLMEGENTLSRRARAHAAAGSDARMSGCELPVCIISGSGNQGITASVPVKIYADEMGAPEEELLRALLVSDLITIHQKNGIGTLSAYCGAVSAGVGAGAGICYLHGGRYYEIAHTLVNAVAIISGTICDGAKPSCAAKIAMAVEAGIMGFEMAKTGRQFLGGDGIVTKGVENTIRNVGRLARDGMSGTDREIISIMLGK
jgi:L-cysteine desulfidase